VCICVLARGEERRSGWSDLKRGIDKIMSHQKKEQQQHHFVHLPHRYSHHGKG